MKRILYPTTLAVLCLLQAACTATGSEQACCENNPTTHAAPMYVPRVLGVQVATGNAQSAYGVGGEPQLFDNLGQYTRDITTNSAQAQRYFNQGLSWLYGFNHDEAVRSFTRAAELDPGCAMAWWGVAYAQGPNYNGISMGPARERAAWDATAKALEQLDNESPVEYALINALTARYAEPVSEDNASEDNTSEEVASEENTPAQDRPSSQELRNAFAQAMAEIWARYPDDADVGTLYAESMMLKNPWRLYKTDETPARDETLTITQTLEAVFAFAPEHPGANHFYIHAMEAGADKLRAVPAAERLSTLVPLSGHLTHMPSHIYVQVGMWDRAVEQNLAAIQTDAAYLSRSPDQYRQRGYAAHNGHMLAFAAMMSGREQDAMLGARFVWEMPVELYDTMGLRYDRAMCAIYDVQKRFGRWDALLAEPAPPAVFRQSTAVWRACRAVAFAAKKDFVNAQAEHAAFRSLLEARPNDDFLKLNDRFIAGEIALQQDDWATAATLLEEAVAIEDAMGYGEPPRWLQPVRHTLGAVYLKAERYEDAERTYREDLERWPGNGWSLYGLTRALQAQGKTEEAATTHAAYEQAWRYADRPLETTCECIPEI